MKDEISSAETATYRIKVKGILDEKWSDWFDGFSMYCPGNNRTVLEGPVPDQEALHGLIARIRDLGLPICSITCLSFEEDHESDRSVPPRGS
jgi:hypothetical protein